MPDKTARRLLRVLSGFNSPMTKNQRYNQGCNDQDSIEDCNGCGVMRNNTQDPAAIHCGEAWGLSIRWRLGGARISPHAPVHRLDEPAGISLGMVASPQCPLPFRPASSL